MIKKSSAPLGGICNRYLTIAFFQTIPAALKTCIPQADLSISTKINFEI
jgi:hypothetical protein